MAEFSWAGVGKLHRISDRVGAVLTNISTKNLSSHQVPQLSKECLVALRCGRDCTDLKVALRQELCNLEEVKGRLSRQRQWAELCGVSNLVTWHCVLADPLLSLDVVPF